MTVGQVALAVMIAMCACACSTDRALPAPQPTTGRVHPTGILDANSDAFHGKELARRGYDLELCATCHGGDFAGGVAKVTCLGCHAAGPDACTTCHGEGPSSGAHLAHRTVGQACVECHVVPARWDAEGHVRNHGEPDPSPAEITFGVRASTDTPDRQGPATYADGTCTNVYCHGAALHAGGGTTTAPRWEAAPTGGCTQCHGAPPPSHVQTECANCHRVTVAQHIDGKLDVGTDCNGCHRSTPVFANLAGSSQTSELTVGAHQAHITGASGLRGPIACDECHLVPTATGDAGHIDSLLPAEVFPAGSGTLARADSANPVWDRMTGTCSGAYCHGNGIWLASDPVTGTTRTPSWTAPGQVYCGSCHGVPPASHPQTFTLRDCATCHPSVDGSGFPIVVGGTSKHLDGVVDVL